MPLRAFQQSIQEVRPIVALCQELSDRSAALSYTSVSLATMPSYISSGIVLLVARFEQFLKDAGRFAADQYGRATPAVRRSQLSDELQLAIIKSNMQAAMREKEHGVPRGIPVRIQHIHDVASRIAADRVWGDDVIETSGNPDSTTVKSILSLLGVGQPWDRLESEFRVHWSQREAVSLIKSVPSARRELDSIVTWRHSVAHTSSLLPVSSGEFSDAVSFFMDLSTSIYDVLSSVTDAKISTCGCQPSAWPR